MERYRLAFRYFRRHSFTRNDKRNLRLGGVVSLYGISFAIEKLLLTLGCPLSDFYWLLIYGLFALLSTFWWIEDSLLDLWEEHTTEDDILYNEEVKS